MSLEEPVCRSLDSEQGANDSTLDMLSGHPESLVCTQDNRIRISQGIRTKTKTAKREAIGEVSAGEVDDQD